MSSDDHSDLHGRPPLSVPFPLQLSEEGILPRHGSDTEPAPPSGSKAPSPASAPAGTAR